MITSGQGVGWGIYNIKVNRKMVEQVRVGSVAKIFLFVFQKNLQKKLYFFFR